MSELKAVEENGHRYIDSRDLADYLGRRHVDVLKAIRKIRDELKSDPFIAATERVEFEKHFLLRSTEYRNIEWPYYLLTARGCELYSTKLQRKSLRWSFYIKAQEALSKKENESHE